VLSVGVATSAHVDGPFEDVTGKPLLRYRGEVPLGIIDPTMYVHEGTPHLLWKDDGSRSYPGPDPDPDPDPNPSP